MGNSKSSVKQHNDEESYVATVLKRAIIFAGTTSLVLGEFKHALFVLLTLLILRASISLGKKRSKRTIKIMTYNVWLHEDVKRDVRIKAIIDLIKEHQPHVIFLQEVTPKIYKFFERSELWDDYTCSLSPEDAVSRPNFCILLTKLRNRMEFSEVVPLDGREQDGKELTVAEIRISNKQTLIVATTHLTKQDRPREPNITMRKSQATEAINSLNPSRNVVFGGDMNWVEEVDGSFPLQNKWVDAWRELHPMEDGWTYDTISNAMLKGQNPLRARLDRFLCKFEDFKLVDVEIIGSDPIPGVSYQYQNRKPVPVYPSDHYGLLLTIGLK